LTDGRLEIGLGAGWASKEYHAVGMAFDRPGKRLARLKSSVAIVKQALSEGRIDRPEEDAYGAIQLNGMPRSIQRPHPPILIGGGGPRTLAFAGAEAQIVGIDPRAQPTGGQVPGDITEAIVDQKVGWIREAAGDRAAELEINLIIFDVDPSYRPGSGHTSIQSQGLTGLEIARSPHYLVGDSEAMVDLLIERRERWGINYLAIKPEHMAVLAPVVARLAGT
jgi:probable F420-dependent oxidoreductase